MANIAYNINTIGESRGLSQQVMFAFGLLILTLTPKIIALIVLFSEDIFRVFKTGFNYFSSSKTTNFFPERRTFVSKLALGLAAIPFSTVLYGMFRGKYNFQVVKHTLYFEDLPTAFDSYNNVIFLKNLRF